MACHKNLTGFNTAHNTQQVSLFPANSEHPSMRFSITAGYMPKELQNLAYEDGERKKEGIKFVSPPSAYFYLVSPHGFEHAN